MPEQIELFKKEIRKEHLIGNIIAYKFINGACEGLSEDPFIELEILEEEVLSIEELSEIIKVMSEAEIELKAIELKESIDEIMSEETRELLRGIKGSFKKLGRKWRLLKLLIQPKNCLFKEDWGMDRTKETQLHYANNHISIALSYMDNVLMDLRKKKLAEKQKLEIWSKIVKKEKIKSEKDEPRRKN